MAEPDVSYAAAAGGGKLRNAFGGVLCAFTLLLIGVLAFSIRLFSVRSVLLHVSRSSLVLV
jgi:dolichyl-diphosphooligosaccharide---protein glycosyltransferase